ncbi:hypothetical protein LTR53_010497 [Teratosphaeriaceae sp. CCFEE 6253]|nr:hypothetical protein LTR53_010497 [Teratosphaeriaceae sp. CCFEE 6253]
MKLTGWVTLATAAAASPTSKSGGYGSNGLSSIISSLEKLLSGVKSGTYAPVTTQIISDYIEPIEERQTQILRNSYVVRKGTELQLGGKRWTASGANVYWLGLDENVIPPAGAPFYAPFNASYPTKGRITEVMNTLVTMGAHTIRSQTLGVSVGNPLSLEPALNEWNAAAFDTIDWSVYQAREHGLRIFAPLIDNYDYYHGGRFDFLRFHGINISSTTSPIDPLVMQFYTNRTIINDFKTYIRHLLTHVNPYTGLTYAEDPTIFAYETGNELGGPVFGDTDVPTAWTDEICSYVKQLGPHKLCIDGTYGVNNTHLSIASIDIFDNHFYPLNITKLEDDIARVGAAGKVYLAGEYDWTGNVASAPSLQSFYDVIEARQNLSSPVVAGDLFWSLFMHDVPNCNIFVNHSDGFALQYGNPANTAQNNTQIATIRQHFFRMQNETVSAYLPAVACPGNYEDLTYSPGVMDFEGDVY